jgi:hypothetical protein
VIPDNCKAFFDIRVTEKFANLRILQKEIESIVSQYDAKLISVFKGDLVHTDPSHKFITSYAQSYKQVT